MAIVPLHKSVTRRMMQRFGFNGTACDIAAAANARVDEKQGNSASEANLHAMCGYAITTGSATGGANPLLAPNIRIQSEQECRAAVRRLLDDAKRNIVDGILAGRYRWGLARLGAALHTVQDRAFHRFEPWPHAGIGTAILTDFNYMVMHGVRDLGHISRLGLTGRPGGRLGFELEANTRIGDRAWLGARGFTGRSSEGFTGRGGMLTLTFGAPPGSAPDASSGSTGGTQTSLQRAMRHGPRALAEAEDATTQFIREVRVAYQRRRHVHGFDRHWSAFLRGAPPPNQSAD